MKTYRASQTIAAPPEVIWAILTRAEAYPEWDPGTERIEGQIAAGQRLKAFTKLSPGRAFPVRVTHFEPPRKMSWTGGMPLGLFKGERTFYLTPQDDGTTRFDLRESFSGLLLPLFGRTIPDLAPAFEQFAAGLKERAESSAPPTQKA